MQISLMIHVKTILDIVYIEGAPLFIHLLFIHLKETSHSSVHNCPHFHEQERDYSRSMFLYRKITYCQITN